MAVSAPVVLLAMLVVSPLQSSPPQVTSSDNPPRAVLIKAARDLITKARYGALVTIGEDGQPHARAVDTFPAEADMTVWIGTNPITRKVREIRKDPRVTLYYFEPGGSGYVTILGRAEVVTDPAQKAIRWKEDWASFYADKNRGDDYVLIKVVPRRVEIVSYPHKILNDPKTWTPVSIDFNEEGVLTTHAAGTFDVKLNPLDAADAAEGTSLGRMSIDKTFHGDLEGTSKGQMLTAGTPVNGSAGYVAIERVTAALRGRKGSFILQHTGTMNRGAPQLTITVVPDSGTGDLAGLTGTMTIEIAAGKHSYGFDYTLPEKP